MIDFAYLYKGLCGLARAHLANTMAGHLGAAVVAGYFLGEEFPDLPPQVVAAIEKELDQILQGKESLWFDARKAGITVEQLFAPLPDEPADEQQIRAIADALAANIDQTRQSGHNVIFASIAIRALHDHPHYATPSVLRGIVKLTEGFHHAASGRGYFGQQRGWIVGNQVDLPPDDSPVYRDEAAMADIVVEELIRSAAIRRQGFGGLFHVINHATGLTELTRYGYPKLARQGLAAHRQHLRLWRSLPDVEGELGPLRKADHSPLSKAYWKTSFPSQWSARTTHRIKTLYGFFTLLRFIDDVDKRKRAKEMFQYLMA